MSITEISTYVESALQALPSDHPHEREILWLLCEQVEDLIDDTEQTIQTEPKDFSLS